MLAVALLLFTTVVPVTVFTNLNALRADELSRLGTALMNANQPQSAEWFLRASLALQPESGRLRCEAGPGVDLSFLAAEHASSGHGCSERASNAYSTAHRINPHEPDYLLQLATLEGLWRTVKSAADQRRIISRMPAAILTRLRDCGLENPQVLNECGKVRLRVEDFPGARTSFERSLSLDNASPETHLLYGDALIGGGSHEQALREYETAEMLSTEKSLPAISGRALALARLSRFRRSDRKPTDKL